jgi:anti-sigma regulatory factor (Ser/Thr protein kinase)
VEVTVLINRIIPIHAKDSSQVGNARRQAMAMAGSLGFEDTRQGELGIIVTEAARNIATHADSGELILCPWSSNGMTGIDIFALDRGKGITNLDKALEDGYSTAGTAGQGMGAMQRLAGVFQIYSAASHGTALFARVFHEPAKPHAAVKFCEGAINLAVAGEPVCGDAWGSRHTPHRSIYIVADGLGHGPLAADAAQEALRVFHESSDRSPEHILKEIHGALAKTRGAAVSIAEVLYDKRSVNYAGAGNIAGVIWSKGKSRSMVSMNGTVGHSVGKFQSFSYPWESNSMLIMHSDGLATKWALDQYPGLAQRHPALIAAVLFRDFSRKRDDATIVVSRIQSE